MFLRMPLKYGRDIMKVELLSHSPLSNIIHAGLTCTDRLDKLPHYLALPETFISRLLKAGHESVIEHVVYTFKIEDITRGLLQQLARHRLISLSVQSTRWALDRVLDGTVMEELFYVPEELEGADRDKYIEVALKQLQQARTLAEAFGNDVGKYIIPECMYTDLVMTVNARELRHIFQLRAKPPALKEFNILVREIYNVLPDSHKFMFEEFVK